MTGYTTFSLSYPLISTPPNCFNIRFICVCCNFCSYSANMLGNNTTISLTVISPNSFINSLFIKDLARILRKQFHNIKFLFGKPHTLTVKEQATL